MKELIDSYIAWLKEKIDCRQVNGHYEITTPFLNHLNDHIQFYLKRDERNRILMTDDGETIGNLELAGLDVSTPARKRELDSILNGFGVAIKGRELVTTATPETFPKRKHNFLQALMAVDDLYVIASPRKGVQGF